MSAFAIGRLPASEAPPSVVRGATNLKALASSAGKTDVAGE